MKSENNWFFASDPEEVKEFLLYLEETAKEKSEINIPHYVVFVLNEKLLESISLGKSFLYCGEL